MGWIFLWAFLDKTFGLGFATAPGNAWIIGGSPTDGFLKFATKGPFAETFQSLAGVGLVDWLFMLGLLFVGLGLLLGVWVRLASYSGALILMLMYLAGFIWPEHNPFMDEHIMYAVLMFAFPLADSSVIGISEWWNKTSLVRKYRILRS
mgnify:CR=1 FL=1